MNKVVLVTGSSIGIGASTIEKFAKENYNVVINYVTHEKEANYLKDKIEKKYGVKCLCIKCDISNENEINSMFNTIINEFGKINVLVNNAGYTLDSEFNDKTKSNFMKTLEINLVGTFLVSRIFGNYMYENKSGCIVNVSSNNAIDSYDTYSLEYDASKAGIINLNHNLALKYAPYVRVNTICPGWVLTDSVLEMNPNYLENEKKKILLNRFASCEEIANIIYFLSSNESSYINDSIIKVDGGINVKA